MFLMSQGDLLFSSTEGRSLNSKVGLHTFVVFKKGECKECDFEAEGSDHLKTRENTKHED